MSLRSAQIQAKKSKHKQHRVGAVVVKGGRILSYGHNQIRPSKELKTETIHAEEAAILQAIKVSGIQSLAGSKIYVTRYTKGNKVGLAKPCARCMGLISSVGIRSVNYTTDFSISFFGESVIILVVISF